VVCDCSQHHAFAGFGGTDWDGLEEAGFKVPLSPQQDESGALDAWETAQQDAFSSDLAAGACEQPIPGAQHQPGGNATTNAPKRARDRERRLPMSE